MQISISDTDRELDSSTAQAISQTNTSRTSELHGSTDDNVPKNNVHNHNNLHSAKTDDKVMQNKDMSYIDPDQWTFMNDATVNAILNTKNMNDGINNEQSNFTDSDNMSSDGSDDSNSTTAKKKRKSRRKRMCRRQRLSMRIKKERKKLLKMLPILKRNNWQK